MAKGRQLVLRIDDDLAEVMEEDAERLQRSRATIVCAALHIYAALPAEAREKAVMGYLRRERPGPRRRSK